MSDLISRQEALSLAKDICVPTADGITYKHRCVDPDEIRHLPSAQPEVIWCKDCKYWYAFSDKKFGYCRRECWDDDGRYRLKVEMMYDDFCSRAEKRTDESMD